MFSTFKSTARLFALGIIVAFAGIIGLSAEPVAADMDRDRELVGIVHLKDRLGGCGETRRVREGTMFDYDVAVEEGVPNQVLWDLNGVTVKEGQTDAFMNAGIFTVELPCFNEGYLDPAERHRVVKVLDTERTIVCYSRGVFCPVGFKPAFFPSALANWNFETPSTVSHSIQFSWNVEGKVVEMPLPTGGFIVVDRNGQGHSFETTEAEKKVLRSFAESGNPARVTIERGDALYAISCLIGEPCPLTGSTP